MENGCGSKIKNLSILHPNLSQKSFFGQPSRWTFLGWHFWKGHPKLRGSGVSSSEKKLRWRGRLPTVLHGGGEASFGFGRGGRAAPKSSDKLPWKIADIKKNQGSLGFARCETKRFGPSLDSISTMDKALVPQSKPVVSPKKTSIWKSSVLTYDLYLLYTHDFWIIFGVQSFHFDPPMAWSLLRPCPARLFWMPPCWPSGRRLRRWFFRSLVHLGDEQQANR